MLIKYFIVFWKGLVLWVRAEEENRSANKRAQSFLFKRFYLFIFREGKGRRKRGRETSLCGCRQSAPHWGPGLQPRHVPWESNWQTFVSSLGLSPPSHTSQGQAGLLLMKLFYGEKFLRTSVVYIMQNFTDIFQLLQILWVTPSMQQDINFFFAEEKLTTYPCLHGVQIGKTG